MPQFNFQQQHPQQQSFYPSIEGGPRATSFQGSLDRLEEAIGSLRGKVHRIDSRIDGLTDRMSITETRILGQLDS